MRWVLEVVCVPVTDVERSTAFHVGPLGFAFFAGPDGNGRVVQQITARA